MNGASQNTRLANQARGLCQRNGLFLLVEVQPGPCPQERWALLCSETGRQVATIFPHSPSVMLHGEAEARRCRNWQDAVVMAGERRAMMAARLKESRAS
jgi:hypothetical protein